MVAYSDAVQSRFVAGLSIVVNIRAIMRPVWIAYVHPRRKFLPFVSCEIEKKLLSAIRTLGGDVSSGRRPVGREKLLGIWQFRYLIGFQVQYKDAIVFSPKRQRKSVR